MLSIREVQDYLTAEGINIGKAAAAGNMRAQRLIDLSAGASELLSLLVRSWAEQHRQEGR